jgi:hypothetical protein
MYGAKFRLSHRDEADHRGERIRTYGGRSEPLAAKAECLQGGGFYVAMAAMPCGTRFYRELGGLIQTEAWAGSTAPATARSNSWRTESSSVALRRRPLNVATVASAS